MKKPFSVFIIPALAFVIMSASPISKNTMNLSNDLTATVKPLSVSFDFFRTHRQGRGITSTWGLTSQTGVAGFIIQRTYEDPTDPYAFWEDIGSLPCNLSRSYKWTDENVFPGFISYQIVAVMNDGSRITSWVNTIHIISH
jgi:hypothetical protein